MCLSLQVYSLLLDNPVDVPYIYFNRWGEETKEKLHVA